MRKITSKGRGAQAFAQRSVNETVPVLPGQLSLPFMDKVQNQETARGDAPSSPNTVSEKGADS